MRTVRVGGSEFFSSGSRGGREEAERERLALFSLSFFSQTRPLRKRKNTFETHFSPSSFSSFLLGSLFFFLFSLSLRPFLPPSLPPSLSVPSFLPPSLPLSASFSPSSTHPTASTLARRRRPSEIAVVRDATPAGCLPNPEDLRSSTLSDLLSPPPASNASCAASIAVLDVRWNSQITATLNLVRTAFIVATLALGITLMQRDAARLVLRPMERMLSKVRAVAENPLATKRARLESRGVPEREKLMETRILENAINKICSLLAVGFGDAGAEVIAGNMRSGGELDPVVPGRRVAGVFGFCDIRQFTDATEVLQEEVMGFVNTIARIVHREVSLHGGAPNKNVGDAFLLVWMFPDGVSDASLAEALEYVEARENGGVAGGVGGEGSEDENASPAAAAVAPGRELDIAITLQKASFFF